MERAELIARLRGFLLSEHRVRVAWLGGADASGRVDDRSDVDLVIAVGEADREDVFKTITGWFDEEFGIRAMHRLRDPTPHGHSQALYLGRRLSDDLALDLMVMPIGTPSGERFLEVERHGRAIPLVDRLGWLDEDVPNDAATRDDRIDRHLDRLAGMHPFQHPMVERAIDRGHWSEAMDGYQRRMLRPLCDLMRIEHDPDRFDFGFRYVDRDLPEADRELLEHLSFVPDFESLRQRVTSCREEFDRRLQRIIDAR
jgi:hypothetical protein